MDPSFVVVLLFLGAAVFLWLQFGRGSGADPEALQGALDAGATIVDVRTQGEFAMGHIEGALNIPVDSLGLRLSELGEPGGTPVVVYCRSGARSRRAASILSQAGFTVIDAGTQGAFPAELRA